MHLRSMRGSWKRNPSATACDVTSPTSVALRESATVDQVRIFRISADNTIPFQVLKKCCQGWQHHTTNIDVTVRRGPPFDLVTVVGELPSTLPNWVVRSNLGTKYQIQKLDFSLRLWWLAHFCCQQTVPFSIRAHTNARTCESHAERSSWRSRTWTSNWSDRILSK